MSCCLFVDFSLCRVMLEMGCHLLNGVLMILSYECYCQTQGWISNEDLELFNLKNPSFSSLITERNVFYKLYCQIIKYSKFKPCLLQGFVISRDIPGFRESRVLFLWSGFAAGIRSLTASFKLYSVATIYTIQNTKLDLQSAGSSPYLSYTDYVHVML